MNVEATTLNVPSSKTVIDFYSKLGFVIDTEQPDLIDEITWMTMSLNTHRLDN